MSTMKRMADDRIFKGGWRPLAYSPSRDLWAGGTARAACPECRSSWSWMKDEKIPERCPRCGARLEER